VAKPLRRRGVGEVRRAAKVDANHEAVVSALRSCGATVHSLATVGDGCPDLLVGWRGMTILFEVKDGKKPPSKRRLTQEQVDWHAAWRGGMVAIVESPEAALALLEVRT
jgi:hypothetical protein